MVVCFLEGWGKAIATKMPPRKYMETFAELIYSAAEFVPNGKITIKGIGDWVDGNDGLMDMLQTYEPANHIEDESSVFLPLPRKQNHLKVLSSVYLGKSTLITLQNNDNYSNYSTLTKKNWGKNENAVTFTELATMRGLKNISSLSSKKLCLKPFDPKLNSKDKSRAVNKDDNPFKTISRIKKTDSDINFSLFNFKAFKPIKLASK